MTDLKPCPCGKVPEKLRIVALSGGFWRLSGECCDAWEMTVFLPNAKIGQLYADWNEAPRGVEAEG